MKQKKFRLTYREHSEAEIYDAIRKAIPEGGIVADVLTDACLEPIVGATEWDRGVKEGGRRLAGWLLAMARHEQDTKKPDGE